jgi:DEAD/DEAH box helicase domain-containing protein
MPIYPGLVQGHLACAGLEFPICGPMNVSMIKSTNDPKVRSQKGLLSDYDLFGSKDVCREALETLLSQGSLIKEIIPVNAKDGKAVIYKTHPSIRNPWTRVSIRSMESVNYEIVDVSHPKQG